MTSVLKITKTSGSGVAYSKTLPVKNGVTVRQFDLVSLDGESGAVDLLLAQAPAGIVLSAGTTTGNSGLTEKVDVCIDPNVEFLLDNDEDGGASTGADVGKQGVVIGTTNAQLIDTSSLTLTTTEALPIRILQYRTTDTGFSSNTSVATCKFANHIYG